MPRTPLLQVAALAALGLLAGCSRAVTMGPGGSPVTGLEEVGMASWYGAQHQGRRTASGEVFDMNQLTAAHRTLPFGTRLLVTNRDTSQTAEVRVNDRGPWVDRRILDVSYAAARMLGAVGPGVIPVRVRVVSLPGAGKAAAPAGEGPFAVQVGAFSSRTRAEALREAVGGEASVAPATVAGETVYRVRVGVYADRGQARAAARELASRGFPATVVDR